MCSTCGCEDNSNIKIYKAGEENHEEHNHEHEHHHHNGTHHIHEHKHDDQEGHTHKHDHDHTNVKKILTIEQDLLSKNKLVAERNRGYFEAKNIFCINLVSSPGSGKTSLLEKTISALKEKINFYVIEGDQQTANDAKRIEATGVPVVQINTGNGCHLDASMINTAMKKLEIKENSLLIIENVGNLVCPSMFDLGERKRVVIISVTEGDDKPLKYPNMFQSSDICLINKTDLLPYVDFDINKVKENALKVNHHLEIFEVSVKTGEGLEDWYNWLKS
jgi:hydrogenase nickel incorporation protein HypB